jgi:hypothetical protein
MITQVSWEFYRSLFPLFWALYPESLGPSDDFCELCCMGNEL